MFCYLFASLAHQLHDCSVSFVIRLQSPHKLLLVRFFAGLIDAREASATGVSYSALSPTIRAFVRSLPRLLWELKTTSLGTTEEVLDVLTAVARRTNDVASTSDGIGGEEGGEPMLPTIDELQPGLALLFHGTFGKKSVLGPFLSAYLRIF